MVYHTVLVSVCWHPPSIMEPGMTASNSPSRQSASLQRFRLDGIRDTGITVGYGSYATVLQYDFRGLKCAGKKIHRQLYEHNSGTQRADMLKKIAKECELLGRLHHPNIVQFLGVHVETGSELPVLVMEYLPINLSGYLDRHGVLPTEISYGILCDVALGLRYLHENSPPIVHRDLSANNVLLTASISAKISDLGLSKVITPSHLTQQMSTKASGTPCYMPPEALLISEPGNTRKIDSYSFGVMILHVLCGKWPFPADAFQCDPHDPDILVPVTEVDRRTEYLKKMGSDHPLLKLVHQCLSNAPNQRPESADILQQINTALSQVPAPAETVLQLLEGLKSDNQRLETENQSLINENLRLRSDVQRLRTRIQNLKSENERLKNENQTLNKLSQTQTSIQSGSGATINHQQKCEIGITAQLRPLPVWIEWCGHWRPSGYHDVILIISNGKAMAKNIDIVPHCSFRITRKDKKMMVDQGISPDECRDDISIVQARVRLDNKMEMVGILCSDGKSELSRGYVLQQLENLLKRTVKPGVIIYYIGPGKRNTGDWCFKDGFITFRDIAELYSCVFRHRALTIITDCSHSGAWVDACVKYLDEQGVRPCGHSLKEKGIVLEVYASCRPEEVAATNCFSVRAAVNDKNDGGLMIYYNSLQLRESQQTYGLDTTVVRCGRSIKEACTLQPQYSWRRWSESKRIVLYRGKDHGKQSWKYVLLEDNPEKARRFKQLTQTKQTVNAAEYGEVVKAGWGKNPPQEVIDEIDSTYHIFYM